MTSTANQQLKEFINSTDRNIWIKTKLINVYVRKGFHSINGKTMATLDVANVSVPNKYQGSGVFKEFMTYAKSFGYPIYVESILNPIVTSAVQRWGYDIINDGNDAILYNDKEPPWAVKLESKFSLNTFLSEGTDTIPPDSKNIETSCYVNGVTFNQSHGLGANDQQRHIIYLGYVAMMTPVSFLDIVKPFDILEKEVKALDILEHIKNGKSIASPMLVLNMSPIYKNYGQPECVLYDGISRCLALIQMGFENIEIPVHILIRAGRWNDLDEECLRRTSKGIAQAGSDGYNIVIQPYRTCFWNYKKFRF